MTSISSNEAFEVLELQGGTNSMGGADVGERGAMNPRCTPP